MFKSEVEVRFVALLNYMFSFYATFYFKFTTSEKGKYYSFYSATFIWQF